MCHRCDEVFQDNDTKHHCRACGEGFCDNCSSKTRPVPERGWGLAPVRVCDVCFDQRGLKPGMTRSASSRENPSHFASCPFDAFCFVFSVQSCWMQIWMMRKVGP